MPAIKTLGRRVPLLETGRHESFLGIYKPTDGKDGLFDLPNLGIEYNL